MSAQYRVQRRWRATPSGQRATLSVHVAACSRVRRAETVTFVRASGALSALAHVAAMFHADLVGGYVRWGGTCSCLGLKPDDQAVAK